MKHAGEHSRSRGGILFTAASGHPPQDLKTPKNVRVERVPEVLPLRSWRDVED